MNLLNLLTIDNQFYQVIQTLFLDFKMLTGVFLRHILIVLVI